MRKFKRGVSLMLAGGMVAFLLSALPIAPSTVRAAACTKEVTFLTIKPWYHNLCKEGTNNIEVTSDKGGVPAFATVLILNIISIAVQVAGYAAVGMVIWGGVKYMTAAGDSSKIASGKSIVTNALIGLLIVLAAVAIIDFVIGQYP